MRLAVALWLSAGIFGLAESVQVAIIGGVVTVITAVVAAVVSFGSRGTKGSIEATAAKVEAADTKLAGWEELFEAYRLDLKRSRAEAGEAIQAEARWRREALTQRERADKAEAALAAHDA